MKPLSILFLGTQMAVGGAQKVLLDQAGWFHARGHRVTAAFFYDRDSLREKWQAEFPFPVLSLSGFDKGRGILQNGFSILGGLARLWTLLRRERFDVIETFTHDSNTLALPLAWAAGTPVRIASHHGIVAGIEDVEDAEEVDGGVTLVGTTPGLYGGTRDETACDDLADIIINGSAGRIMAQIVEKVKLSMG